MDIQAIAKEHGVSANEVRSRFLVHRVALWKSDFPRFAREVVNIRTKRGELKPLTLNAAQKILHDAGEKMLAEDKWIRLIAVKGRRQGFSTYVEARGYWRATLWDRQKIYILSHEMKSADALFAMVALMQEKNDFAPEVGADNAKELEFKQRGSSYTVATAGAKAGGRGAGVSFFHGSEAAWWVNAADHFAASVQSVDEVKGKWGVLWRRPEQPLPFEKEEVIEGWVQAPSEIWLETTSAGPVGEYYKRYREAMSGVGRYRHVFVPWTIQREYSEEGDFIPGEEPEEEGGPSEREYQELHDLTDEQMLWRRGKVHELGSYGRFRQEYPTTIEEAFSEADEDEALIKGIHILRARKRKMDTPDAPLIVGVDPAGAGGDKFAVAWRRGDKCIKIKYRHRLEHDAAVAWITSIIDEDKPSRVCIDRGAMGNNILSSIRALNPKYASVMKGVDFGGRSQAKQANPDRTGPVNRRAEIYGRLKEWLPDASIPDDDDLASDLASPRVKYRANNDWMLESKVEIKQRIGRSPDLGDALALTFATQEFFQDWTKPEKAKGFSAGEPKVIYLDQRDKQPSLGGSAYGWMG